LGLSIDDTAFSAARQFCDGGRRDGPPLTPPSNTVRPQSCFARIRSEVGMSVVESHYFDKGVA
jgi:hypothetical protein